MYVKHMVTRLILALRRAIDLGGLRVVRGTPLVLAALLASACGGKPEVTASDDIFEEPDAGDGGSVSEGGTGGRPGLNTDAGDAEPEPEPEAVCGNGELEPGELCDDGGEEDGDGCSADCREQDPDYDCSVSGEPCVNTVICGNGRLEGDEGCDDGNTMSGDGCTADCAEVEEGYACTRPGSPCLLLPVCGNGQRERGEQCDDGQSDPMDGDGCSASCQLEDGYYCPTPGQACVAIRCGDGVRTPGEACDDGQDPPQDGDGCSSACEVEPGFRCSTNGCFPICGDGLLRGTEACDDGNRITGDGCSAACVIEPFTSCSGEPSVCSSTIVCGNGVREPGEVCDPPGTDGCLPGCLSFSPDTGTAMCGNSQIEANEGCDPPDVGNGCSAGCTVEMGFSCPLPGVCFPIPRCGDGIVNVALGEECDDGDATSGDGCSACTIDMGWSCVGLGPSSCTQEVCGDGVLTPSEECDDGNLTAGDGCTQCDVDSGWVCPFADAPCFPRCGDGVLTGDEECDDNNRMSGDGCNSVCRVEPGHTCPTPGETCDQAICGNGDVEAGEGCDDGNSIAGDGCSATCQNEPTFIDGVAQLTCGDGLITGDEECDDGNTSDGDGCSSECEEEEGFDCRPIEDYPGEVEMAVTYRDFKTDSAPGGHPDFERQIDNLRLGIAGPVCTTANTATCGRLDADGKPQKGSGTQPSILSAQSYSLWYRNSDPNDNVDFAVINDSLPLTQQGGADSDIYQFVDGTFFPLDGRGHGNSCGDPGCCGGSCTGRNFHFTTEIKYFFQYQGGETLNFRGDDDVWVFINNRLAVDIGGVHGVLYGRVVLGDENGTCSVHGDDDEPGACSRSVTEEDDPTDDRFGITKGGVYQIAFFHAERHTTESNFQLTLSGFLPKRSFCEPICGDGIVVTGEVCDDGPNNQDGVSGACNTHCTAFSYCGDGVQQAGESCDNGENLDLYLLASDPNACAPGCVLPPRCGDGVPQPGYEQCDNGAANDDASYGPNSCTTACTFGGYCGDGELNGGETCDLGAQNGVTYGPGSCGYDCEPGPRCGDGVRNGPEECDGGENCSDTCELEPFCGDGVVSGGESCDYGQFASNDYGGCTNMCVWGPLCGDANQDDPYEECDLGAENNTGEYGGCTPACSMGPHCGDATVQSDEGEACDNGFNDDVYGFTADACGPECKPVPYCGDGELQSQYELCDEGEDNSDTAYEGCNTRCEWGPYCGDGTKDPQEECDEGVDNRAYSADGTGCGYDCKRAPYCGDGIRNGPERCDLGEENNTGDYGTCNPDCTQSPYCGDGVVQRSFGEECDDGPTGSLNCTVSCRSRVVE